MTSCEYSPSVMTIKLMNSFSAWKGRSSIILMKRHMCPGFKRHVDAHSETLKAIREARKNWDEERDLMQLWNFLEYDYMAWFEHHVRDYDLPAAEFIRQYEEGQ